jgi:thiamine pyrophosphate-dependent acetolactate synthase large subunit-like protein
MAKVAEVLVQTLIEAGIKRVYGVAGDSLYGMTETIRKSGKLVVLRPTKSDRFTRAVDP